MFKISSKNDICFNGNTNKFICPTCERSFSRKFNLERHINNESCKNIHSSSVNVNITTTNVNSDNTNVMISLLNQIERLKNENDNLKNGVAEIKNENTNKHKLQEEKKKKKQAIPKNVRNIVWNHYIGEDIIKHRCLCCKKVLITNTNFEVGHVLSEKNGGTHEINNLRPICGSCNHSMGTENMVEFVIKYGLYIG